MDVLTPDYLGGGLLNLAAELERRLAGGSAHAGLSPDRSPLVPSSPTYVLVLFDGLGSGQLDHPRAASLAEDHAADLDAPFPTTTTVSLATLATAMSPAEHGLIAYLQWVEAAGTIVNTIHMRSAWGEPIDLDPDAFLPHPNLFERLAASGIEPIVVQPANFADSTLTRTLYRGARFEGYRHLGEAVDVTTDVAAHDGRLVLLYVPHVDVAAHLEGQSSDAYGEAIAAADTLWGRLRHRLGPGVTLLGTADHGHVDIDPANKVVLTAGAERSARLWGDGRAMYVTGDPSMVLAETGGTWVPRDALGPLWGPVVGEDRATAMAPDGVVFMEEGTAAFTRYMNEALVGHHGGLSVAERRIPLLIGR